MFIDGTLTPLLVPTSAVVDSYVVPWQIVEPEIGTLKIGSALRRETIRYMDDDFDGWLYPDGSTYDLTAFSLSSKLSGLYGNDDGTTFTLPNLSNFIRLNGSLQLDENGSLMYNEPGRNCTPEHTHSFSLKLSGTIDIEAKAKWSSDVASSAKAKTDFIHRGDGYAKTGYTVWAENGVAGSYLKDTYMPLSTLLYGKPSNSLSAAAIKYWRSNLRSKYTWAANLKDVLPNKGTAAYVKHMEAVENYNVHNSYKKKLDLSCTANVEVANVTIGKAGSESYLREETYPDYNNLPVMIYVGRKKRD